ncbi:hypothetical protein NDU88_005506 [Pleurodeles waltl]|uniref:Uncharacterized protein n=1 Tax=Pleurodeles waltl TaxID=8319 RepID=A0AAV7VM86_PLEWA|nr:hypothetical protein NDU88_005506 [Pleurodeles waltl]
MHRITSNLSSCYTVLCQSNSAAKKLSQSHQRLLGGNMHLAGNCICAGGVWEGPVKEEMQTDGRREATGLPVHVVARRGFVQSLIGDAEDGDFKLNSTRQSNSGRGRRFAGSGEEACSCERALQGQARTAGQGQQRPH